MQTNLFFGNLCSRESLERLVDAPSQNPNKGFHSPVWSMSPKHKTISGTTFEIACHFAIMIFNTGYFALGKKIQIFLQIFLIIIKTFDTYRLIICFCFSQETFSTACVVIVVIILMNQ